MHGESLLPGRREYNAVSGKYHRARWGDKRERLQLRQRVLWSELYGVRHGGKVVGRKQLRNMHGRILLHGQW
jgi:hypothetical protein